MNPAERSLPPARIAVRHGADRSIERRGRTLPLPRPAPARPGRTGRRRAPGRRSSDLMTEAVRAAAARRRRTGTARLGRLRRGAAGIVVADRPGAHGGPAHRIARGAHGPAVEVGVSQQEVINHALAAVAAGRFDTVVVVGRRGAGVGPQRRRSRTTRSADHPTRSSPGRPTSWPRSSVAAGIVLPAGAAVRAHRERPGRRRAPESPTSSATRSPRCGRASTRWPPTTPRLPSPSPARATEIATPGPGNRPLAYPYNRWHASQWTVDQSSALVICSAERARAAGVPPERWLFPHVALHCSEAVTLTARRRLERVARHDRAGPDRRAPHRAAAARHATGRGLLVLSGRGACAAACARARSRRHPHPHRRHEPSPAARSTTSSCSRWARWDAGCATSRPSSAWSRPCRACSPSPAWRSGRPPRRRPAADRSWPTWRTRRWRPPTSSRSSTAHPSGRRPATVASFTVTYGGEAGLEPERTAIVADLPDGVRTAATCEDARTARLAVTEGLIGRAVEVKDTTFSL